MPQRRRLRRRGRSGGPNYGSVVASQRCRRAHHRHPANSNRRRHRHRARWRARRNAFGFAEQYHTVNAWCNCRPSRRAANDDANSSMAKHLRSQHHVSAIEYRGTSPKLFRMTPGCGQIAVLDHRSMCHGESWKICIWHGLNFDHNWWDTAKLCASAKLTIHWAKMDTKKVHS